MLTVRTLSKDELGLAAEIDVSEVSDRVFSFKEGALSSVPEVNHRPPWDAAAWAEKIREWSEVLLWDTVVGAFAGDRLAGMASIRCQLDGPMAQLVSLHVSREQRRRGVATLLMDEIERLAREHGVESIYVTATPSPSAVGFYLKRGFQPTATPHPHLYELEPDDIHMILML